MENMIYYKNLTSDIMDTFINAKYWCFDTETCCHNEKIYNDYFIKQIVSQEKGIHARVYAWALSNTTNDEVIYGHNLDEFLKCLEAFTNYLFKDINKEGYTKISLYNKIKKLSNIEIGVHNLKYDAEFLKYGLFQNGYGYYNSVVSNNTIVGKSESEKCFNIVENGNTVYSMNIISESIEVLIKKKKEDVKENITMSFNIFDTLKIVNNSLDNIAKKVINIDEKYYKLSEEYDYEMVRPTSHILTELEKRYLYNDVYILKEFLRQFYMPLEVNAKTASGIAFKSFLKDKWGSSGAKEFNKKFPNMYEYPFITNIKKSYKGGWTFSYTDYKGKHLKNLDGCSIDINSSYPSVIAKKPLPYGVPKLYKGYKHPNEKQLNLLTIEFNGFYNKDENDKFGFFQASYLNMKEYANLGTDYLPTNIINGELKGYSLDECETDRRFKYYIWEFELEDIMEHTQFIDLIVTQTLQFKAETGLFKDTVDRFIELKNTSKKEKNECMMLFAKLVLNSFYGKLGSNIARIERTLTVDDDDMVKFENTDIEYESATKYYPPFASCVTAWARCNLRSTCYKLCMNKGVFEPNVLYCDTDSIYSLLTSEEIIKRCGKIIDKYELGLWDLEKEYTEFKCIGSKKYMYTEKNGTINCKCAGLPKQARNLITYENFHLGQSFDGKLALKRVNGGYLLIPTKFKLNNNIRF